MGKLADTGHIITFDATSCTIVHSRTPQLLTYAGVRSSTNSLYRLCSPPRSRLSQETSTLESCNFTHADSTHVWHRCLVNFQQMHHMTSRKLIDGVPSLPSRKHHVCETCVLSKHHRSRIPRLSLTSTTRPLELIHLDVCGPIPLPLGLVQGTSLHSQTTTAVLLGFIPFHSSQTYSLGSRVLKSLLKLSFLCPFPVFARIEGGNTYLMQ